MNKILETPKMYQVPYDTLDELAETILKFLSCEFLKNTGVIFLSSSEIEGLENGIPLDDETVFGYCKYDYPTVTDIKKALFSHDGFRIEGTTYKGFLANVYFQGMRINSDWLEKAEIEADSPYAKTGWFSVLYAKDDDAVRNIGVIFNCIIPHP